MTHAYLGNGDTCIFAKSMRRVRQPFRRDGRMSVAHVSGNMRMSRISLFPNTKKGRWRCFKYLADCAKTPGANNPNRFRHLFRGFSAPGASKVITRGDLNEDFGPNLKSMLSFRTVCLNYPTGQRRLRIDSGHPRLGSETWDFMRYPLGRDLTSTTSL